jgi:hypothetical protein
MKKRKYKTIDGDTVELDVAETEEEALEIQRKMQAGEVDDTHGFSDAHRKRSE